MIRSGRLAASAAFVVFAQAASTPDLWLGRWTMDPAKSRVGAIFGPGVPDGLTLTSQSITIENVSGQIRITGDTVLSDGRSAHDVVEASLDGKPVSMAPGVTASFTRIGDLTFEVLVKMRNQDGGDQIGVNRFVVSPDGKTLTETKVHTQTGAIDRSSTSVLVFTRDR